MTGVHIHFFRAVLKKVISSGVTAKSRFSSPWCANLSSQRCCFRHSSILPSIITDWWLSHARQHSKSESLRLGFVLRLLRLVWIWGFLLFFFPFPQVFFPFALQHSCFRTYICFSRSPKFQMLGLSRTDWPFFQLFFFFSVFTSFSDLFICCSCRFVSCLLHCWNLSSIHAK